MKYIRFSGSPDRLINGKIHYEAVSKDTNVVLGMVRFNLVLNQFVYEPYHNRSKRDNIYTGYEIAEISKFVIALNKALNKKYSYGLQRNS